MTPERHARAGATTGGKKVFGSFRPTESEHFRHWLAMLGLSPSPPSSKAGWSSGPLTAHRLAKPGQVSCATRHSGRHPGERLVLDTFRKTFHQQVLTQQA